MLPFARYIRAWLEIDSQAIEPCALYGNIQVSGTTVQLVYPPASSAKLDAVLLGRKFVCTEFRDTTLLEGVASNGSCKLKDRLGKADYVLPVSEFSSENVKILAVKPNGTPVQVQFADPRKTLNTACVGVNENGEFITSESIAGCNLTVHCPIYYPEVVMMTEEPIESLKLHLIGRDGGGILLYAGVEARLQPGKMNRDDGLKVVKLEFDEEAVRLEQLYGTED